MQNLLLEGVVGSRAYGLATADSDTDYAGIYVEPTRRLLGLHPPTRSSRTGRGGADAVYHEVAKAMELMLSCNPTVYELLWLNDYLALTELGRELVALRQCFASAPRVRRAYVGYASAQVRDLRRSPHPSAMRRAKQARHSMRLLWQGYQLYTTAVLPIRLPDPDRVHDFGEHAAAEGADPVRALLAEYETAFDTATTALPGEPDEQPIDDLLQRIRQVYLDREPA
ncbi:nucleotidyltransferase domain-containing protein [Nocardia sp. NPDC052254]|uniref:nucleotidyltransferase domain-containing protein n=1 Tax=Nocardia sp. NPDC052254 TaxID=3155681 RepID=UPI003412AB2F